MDYFGGGVCEGKEKREVGSWRGGKVERKLFFVVKIEKMAAHWYLDRKELAERGK